MRKARILLVLGIWIAVLPYLGFPYSWKDILSSITGLVVIYISYVLYKNYKKTENEKLGESTSDSFRENTDFREKEEVIEQ